MLKNLGFVVVLLLATSGFCQSYLSFPDVSKDMIVFTCEGDLWTVPITGGVASRLTNAQGMECMAKFSPDGSHIAFTGEYDKGGYDVYVMPSQGGEVRRLTYHPYSDWVICWSPGGKDVIFRSLRSSANSDFRIFAVSKDGGFPRQINLGEVARISYSPDGKWVAFTRYSTEFHTWKRYKGGLAPDIWVGNLETLEFKKITDYEGTDAFPMWYGDRIYFISDRNYTMNIFSMRPDGSDVRQHTFHDDYDVRWPSLGHGKIVYHHAGDIWLFDIATGEYNRVDIIVQSDRKDERQRFVDPIQYLTEFSLSPKGKRVAFCARGEIALFPAKEGRLIYLTNTSGIREKNPQWSPDGKSVLYVSDATGEDEIYVIDIFDGKPVQITKNTRGWKYEPVWSPDGDKIAYSDYSQTLYIVDTKTGKTTKVDSSDYWEIREYSWSPDGRYLAYVKPDNHRFRSIFVFDTQDSKIYRVTESFTDDGEPCWDPDGKYLYFLSDRTYDPVFSRIGFSAIVEKMTKPYLVLLDKQTKSPFLPKEPEEMESEDEKSGEKKSSADEKSKEKKGEKEKKPVKIDFEGIGERIVEFPVAADHYYGLSAISGKVFYLSRIPRTTSREDEEEPSWFDLHMYDIKEKKDEVIISNIRSYSLSPDGEKMIYRKGDKFYIVDAGKKGGEEGEKVDISRWRIDLNPKQEWKQIFYEAWRLERDFYWAPDMAKIDWEAIKRKYERLLPRIATRYELHDLIGEMIGELATSHTYIWGGDMGRPDVVRVGLLGADIVAEEKTGRYRIAKIFEWEPSAPQAISPLGLSHTGIRNGDYILAVNGREIDTSKNFYSYFVNLADEEVELTVNDRPDFVGAKKVIVKTLTSEAELRYLDWVRSNRRFVDEASGGRIGYIHIPDMGLSGLSEFYRTFYPQIEKPALIIDVRYNRGGFVSELILEKIAVDVLAYGKTRRGKPYRYPEDGLRAHMVAICNAHAGSDGDIFTRAFKLANLGTVIGTRTWGGVIGIRMDKPLVDGGMVTIPEYAWWEAGEGWNLENWGAVPDLVVDNFPQDVIRGHDVQLEKAVAILNGLLEKQPLEQPRVPPYPDKSQE